MSERKDNRAVQTEALGWGTLKQIGRQLGIIALAVVCWGALLGVLSAPRPGETAPKVVPGQALTWDEHIFPIMQRHCLLCHGSSGGLSLATYESALKGGNHGPAIVPGEAEKSLLYRLLLGPAEGIAAMPLGQAPLSPESIALIEQWITQLPRTP